MKPTEARNTGGVVQMKRAGTMPALFVAFSDFLRAATVVVVTVVDRVDLPGQAFSIARLDRSAADRRYQVAADKGVGAVDHRTGDAIQFGGNEVMRQDDVAIGRVDVLQNGVDLAGGVCIRSERHDCGRGEV